MNENDNLTVKESPEEIPSEPAKKAGGIPKIVWFVGCGCLLLIACAVVVGGLIYLGLTLFGGDPIAAVVPGDSTFYASVDLSKTQSDQFNEIVSVFQEAAEVEEPQTLTDTLDTNMKDELGLSFTDDVVPWLGRHAAFVVTSGDFSGSEAEFMFIVETRSRGNADDFVSKFVAALEDKQDKKFSQDEKDGVTVFTSKAEFDWEDDMVIARAGKFVYLANSEDAVLESINLARSDSLAGSDGYKNAVAALPRNRVATFYMNPEFLNSVYEEMSLYGPSSAGLLADTGLAGIAMSISIVDEGVRLDGATAYDADKIDDFQKETLGASYLDLTTDALVPGDTFFFAGVNTSLGFGRFTEPDSPLYNSDMAESFDLLESEYGISIPDLFDLLSGEFAFAVGPARDGMLAELGEVNVGLTMLASTSDEQGFNDWFDGFLDAASSDLYLEYDSSNTKVGDYQLKELSIQDVPGPYALIYGADNGYIVLGTSKSLLEAGLDSSDTLANNPTYIETWKAFPSDSVPYMYMDVKEFMNFLVDSADSYNAESMRNTRKNLEKIPVVAIAMNQNSNYVQSFTAIVFIDAR
jgi:hypothetical protein